MFSIVPENDPILKLVMPEFDFSSKIDRRSLVSKMFETMYASNGIGLAAPQCGLKYRMFVMDMNGIKKACFNPKIISSSEETLSRDEGCISFPNLWLTIQRPVWIETEFQNENGILVHEKFAYLAASIYSHETDHLNGICFVDLVSRLKLNVAKKKRLKKEKEL